MADDYRYFHQAALVYLQNTPRNTLLDKHQLSSFFNQLVHEPPSPSKSPDPGERDPSSRSMFNQNHQQGHNSRLNGSGVGRGLQSSMLYSYQSAAYHQGHPQHHQGLQPDHGPHNNSSAMGHHAAYSGGVLGNANVFTNGLQNGHGAANRGGQTQQYNEHWQEQLKLYNDSEKAHMAMTEGNQANYYARLKANENKGIVGPSPGTTDEPLNADGEPEDLRRPHIIEKHPKRQDWHNLDLSGQGLRALTPPLFTYTFLHELYIASNRLEVLPAAIGELRHLRHLEASHNQIRELPPELGMCTMLKNLLLFNNNITTLPSELGSLHLLEMLGIEGNPLSSDLKGKIQEQGTKSLIRFLREQMPSKWIGVVTERGP